MPKHILRVYVTNRGDDGISILAVCPPSLLAQKLVMPSAEQSQLVTSQLNVKELAAAECNVTSSTAMV